MARKPAPDEAEAPPLLDPAAPPAQAPERAPDAPPAGLSNPPASAYDAPGGPSEARVHPGPPPQVPAYPPTLDAGLGLLGRKLAHSMGACVVPVHAAPRPDGVTHFAGHVVSVDRPREDADGRPIDSPEGRYATVLVMYEARVPLARVYPPDADTAGTLVTTSVQTTA